MRFIGTKVSNIITNVNIYFVYVLYLMEADEILLRDQDATGMETI